MSFETEQSTGDPHVVEPPEPKEFVDGWTAIVAHFKGLESEMRALKSAMYAQDQGAFAAISIYRMWATNEFNAAVMWRKRAEAAEAELAARSSTAGVTK